MHVQRARSHGKGIPRDDTVISSMHVQRVCRLYVGCYRYRNTFFIIFDFFENSFVLLYHYFYYFF